MYGIAQGYSLIHEARKWYPSSPSNNYLSGGILAISPGQHPLAWALLNCFRGYGNEALVISAMCRSLNFVVNPLLASAVIETNDDIYRYHNLCTVEPILKKDILPGISSKFREWIELKRQDYNTVSLLNAASTETGSGLVELPRGQLAFLKELPKQDHLWYPSPDSLENRGTFVICYDCTNRTDNCPRYIIIKKNGMLHLPSGTFVDINGSSIVTGQILDDNLPRIIFRVA